MRGGSRGIISTIAHDGGLERPEPSTREYSRQILLLAHRSTQRLGKIIRPPSSSYNPSQTGDWSGRIDKQYAALLSEKLEQSLGPVD